ncbi:hypothetical protein GOBAR_DD02280 [Gossypium barbadense]|nr:hypothetical protein GOBAR_DD02280 [Gossypium barbadense]
MELVDDEDVETMVALYCRTRSNQNAPIQLFVELADVETTEDPTPLGEKDGVQEPCMVVPVSYVDSQSTIHGIDIDLNATPENDVVGDDVYYSSDPVDHEVDSESDPDVDEVLDDIDNEYVNEDGNVNVSSVENQIRGIVIHNNPRAHMSWIDPDGARVAEFPEYPEILPAHRMTVYSDPKELLVGQRFERLQIQSTIHLKYPPQPVVPHCNIFFMHFSPIMSVHPPLVHPMDLPQLYWQCRDILYATELPEYSIAMIPLHYLKIDNGCANAP